MASKFPMASRRGGAVASGRHAQSPEPKKLSCTQHLAPVAAPAHLRARPASVRVASARQDEGENPVVAFLKRHDLQVLAPMLLKEGFDDLETLASMDIEDIKDLAISYNDRLRRSLLELRGEKIEETTTSVISFLERHGMSQYASILLESGFDEMQTLSEIEDSDLKDLGFPRGHALKLRRLVREYMMEHHPEEAAREAQAPRGMPQRKPAAHEMARQVSAGSEQSGSGRRVRAVRSDRSAAPVLHDVDARTDLDATDEMKNDVAHSWEQVLAVGTDVVGEKLYKNTFELAPEAMQLFPMHVRQKYQEWDEEESEDPMESQALRKLFSKVIHAVGCAVAGLQDTAKLVPMLLRLGGRHINYGVPEAYWEVLGEALLKTLREIQGPSFTSDVEKAWSVVYAFISSLMIQGLRDAAIGSVATAQKPQRQVSEETASTASISLQ